MRTIAAVLAGLIGAALIVVILVAAKLVVTVAQLLMPALFVGAVLALIVYGALSSGKD